MATSPSIITVSPTGQIMYLPAERIRLPLMTTLPGTSGSSGYASSDEDHSVLDLRKDKMVRELVSPPVTPPQAISPTLSVTQRVLAARNSKTTRPFKAYPKNPLSLNLTPEFAIYSGDILPKLESARACSRKRPSSSTEESDDAKKTPERRSPQTCEKDAAYWERRKKNNEAAKRSRDLRRAKEDDLAVHAAVLEEENLQLKCKVALLSKENIQLKDMIYHTVDVAATHPAHHIYPHHAPPPLPFLPGYPPMM